MFNAWPLDLPPSPIRECPSMCIFSSAWVSFVIILDCFLLQVLLLHLARQERETREALYGLASQCLLYFLDISCCLCIDMLCNKIQNLLLGLLFELYLLYPIPHMHIYEILKVVMFPLTTKRCPPPPKQGDTLLAQLELFILNFCNCSWLNGKNVHCAFCT